MSTIRYGGLAVAAVLALVSLATAAAPACKGPNKYDEGCPVEAAAAAPGVAVDSATVDWVNEKIIVRGTGLDTVGAFALGGVGPLATGAVAATEVELPFDANVASAVAAAGNYSLQLDGSDGIAIYFLAAVVDPAAGGCPCDIAWAGALGGLWGLDQTACYELSGSGYADLAGTILSDPSNAASYPQYPIAAAYYADDPVVSTCRLVEVNDAEPFAQDLVNLRINMNQQANCAALLQANVCATTQSGATP